MWALLVSIVAGVVTAILNLKYDKRTPDEKNDASKKMLGIAIGVPGYFDRR